jgi:hypothetical protein
LATFLDCQEELLKIHCCPSETRKPNGWNFEPTVNKYITSSKGYNWVLVMIEKLFCWHAQSFWFLKQPGINITLPIRIGLRQGASVIE